MSDSCRACSYRAVRDCCVWKSQVCMSRVGSRMSDIQLYSCTVWEAGGAKKTRSLYRVRMAICLHTGGLDAVYITSCGLFGGTVTGAVQVPDGTNHILLGSKSDVLEARPDLGYRAAVEVDHIE